VEVGLLEGLKGFFLDGTEVRTEEVSTPEKRLKMLEKSIIDHLSLLFNERSGSLSHNADHGLPDMSEIFVVTLKRAQRNEKLRAAIEAAVKKFEPRLTNVRVENEAVTAADNKLTFLLYGKLVSRDEMNFKTTFALTEPALVEKNKAKTAA